MRVSCGPVGPLCFILPAACFSHNELLLRSGVYDGMWKQQLKKAAETETEPSSGDEDADDDKPKASNSEVTRP